MRYKLSVWDEQLVVQGVEGGPFPLRAHGFLQFSPKTHPNGELVMEVRGKEIWVWVADKKELGKKGR